MIKKVVKGIVVSTVGVAAATVATIIVKRVIKHKHSQDESTCDCDDEGYRERVDSEEVHTNENDEQSEEQSEEQIEEQYIEPADYS